MTSLWLDRPRVSSAAAEPTFSTTFTAHYDVVVVGAGLVGLSAALLLAGGGRSVAVLEGRELGAGASGNSSGAVSLAQGGRLSAILAAHDAAVLSDYVVGCRLGQDWLRGVAREGGLDVPDVDAVTSATSERGRAILVDELTASQRAGLPAARTDRVDLPFDAGDSVVLPGQFHCDPVELLLALAARLREQGGVLVEGARVTGLRETQGRRGTTLTTGLGDIAADHVVLATGAPVFDRGRTFRTLSAHRSSLIACEVPDPAMLPAAMHGFLDGPVRSVRSVPRAGGDLLLVGGGGHVVGRHPSPLAVVQDLIAWTQREWPGAEPTHAWSGQDYRAGGGLPFVGPLPKAPRSVFVATGFDGWGTTAGAAAAFILAGLVDGHVPAWSSAFTGRTGGLKDVAVAATGGLLVAATRAKEWAEVALAPARDEAPAEGAGVIGTRGASVVAASTVDGCVRRVSGLCPHQSGVVAWNDAERTWDCPLHGSRFAPDGTRLEGPAVVDLLSLDGLLDAPEDADLGSPAPEAGPGD